MKIKAIVLQLNSKFNNQYAKDYCEGKESTDNPKCKYEFSTQEIEIKEFKLKKDIEYNITSTNLFLQNMIVLEITIDNKTIPIGVFSKELVQKTINKYHHKKDITKFYLYLKDIPFKLVDRFMYLTESDYQKIPFILLHN